MLCSSFRALPGINLFPSSSDSSICWTALDVYFRGAGAGADSLMPRVLFLSPSVHELSDVPPVSSWMTDVLHSGSPCLGSPQPHGNLRVLMDMSCRYRPMRKSVGKAWSCMPLVWYIGGVCESLDFMKCTALFSKMFDTRHQHSSGFLSPEMSNFCFVDLAKS